MVQNTVEVYFFKIHFELCMTNQLLYFVNASHNPSHIHTRHIVFSFRWKKVHTIGCICRTVCTQKSNRWTSSVHVFNFNVWKVSITSLCVPFVLLVNFPFSIRNYLLCLRSVYSRHLVILENQSISMGLPLLQCGCGNYGSWIIMVNNALNEILLYAVNIPETLVTVLRPRCSFDRYCAASIWQTPFICA